MTVSVTKARVGIALLSILGVVLTVIGIVAHSMLPSLFKAKLEENLFLKEGKETYEKWRETPIAVSFTVYLWNCTNPIEVEQHGAKPKMQEVGPYVYNQMRKKNVLNWDQENLTVTYDDIKTYYFVEEQSKSLDLMIYTMNMPVVGFAEKARRWTIPASWGIPGINNVLQSYNNSLFLHQPAKALLFEGFKVEFLDDISALVSPFVTMKDGLPNNTFGFLYGKNNTGDGRFTVFTGEDDIAKYTQIRYWNNNSHLLWWNDDYCDMLNGTDGAQFAPPISKEDILYIYTAELCRSVYLEFLTEVEVRGIPAYRFITPTRLFTDAVKNPNNQCYCTKPDFCHISGLLDITTCRKGVPLAVTGPHFYAGDEEYQSKIEGLTPVQNLHETYVDIEPTTGIVLRASRKLQINCLFDPFDGFTATRNAQQMVYPLLWLIEGAEIDQKIADMFNSKVRTPVTIAKSVLTACIVLGILWILTAGFVTLYILIKQQKASRENRKVKYQTVPVKSQQQEKEKL